MQKKQKYPIPFVEPHLLTGLEPTEPILLALSGGADSRSLLHLLAGYAAEYGTPITLAHVDHGIRGEEAVRDREFCRRLAGEYGVEIAVLECDVPALAREHHESLETEARRVRYEFFESVMRERGIKILATAHNADDNLETMLFDLARGCGLRGIGGILPCRPFAEDGLLIRPLLGASKADIISYCEENRLEFVTDSTNAKEDCTRNLIRHSVIPLLERVNPGVRTNAGRLAGLANEADGYIADTVGEYLDREDAYSVVALRTLHPALLGYVLAEMYRRVSSKSVETVHIDAMRELVRRGSRGSAISLPGLIRVRIDEGRRLCFVPDPRKEFRHL